MCGCVCAVRVCFLAWMTWGGGGWGRNNGPIDPFSLRTSVKSSAAWLSGMLMLNSERLLVDLVQNVRIAVVVLLMRVLMTLGIHYW